MNRRSLVIMATVISILALASVAVAQSPFDGTWKTDPSKTQYSGQKPMVMVLQNGVLQTTSSMGTKSSVKADGTDQPGPPEAKTRYDATAVKVVDDKTVEQTYKKDGKVVASSKTTISADGKTMTLEFTRYPEAGKQPELIKVTFTRVAAGPPGSHVISGTWKEDLNKPYTWVIQNGTYQCSVCPDPGMTVNIKADGTDQLVTGSPNFNTLAIKVVDGRTIEVTEKKDGKIALLATNTVSADSKTLTSEYIQPVKREITLTRVNAGPAGSHSISGSWRLQNQSTYKSSINGLIMWDPIGMSFDAQFDGNDYPVKGATGNYTVSLTKVNERSIDVTYKRDGKIVSVDHVTVSADGKTMTTKSENKQFGTTETTIAIKQ